MSDENIKPEDNNAFLTRGCQCRPSSEGENEKVYNKIYCKLSDHDWLGHINLPSGMERFECVEVRFKNSRKDFFRLQGDFEVHVGDIVAVEAAPGHDIGIVSLTGETARMQMKRKKIDSASEEIKKLYRRARTSDIEKWVLSVDKEDDTMYRTKVITHDLKLEMKMNDLEHAINLAGRERVFDVVISAGWPAGRWCIYRTTAWASGPRGRPGYGTRTRNPSNWCWSADGSKASPGRHGLGCRQAGRRPTAIPGRPSPSSFALSRYMYSIRIHRQPFG